MKINNTFDGGMILDALEYMRPTSSYAYALNIINSSREGYAIVNEESNDLHCTFKGVIKGHSQIEERNQCLFFISNGDDSEIWLMDMKTGEPTQVCSDNEFGCKWGFDGCEFLYGEFKQFGKCRELHVYWSSDCVYHVVNIDEMLIKARKQAVIDSQECDYFDMCRVTCGPHLSAIASKNGGSKLEGGVLWFAIQLETNDGGQSNVFDVSQPVYLETENNVPGEISTMSAKLQIQGLSKEWNNVIIYVIQRVGNLLTVKKMPTASYGDAGFTFDYYGQTGELVDISTVLDKSKVWLRGQDLTQKDGKMYFYGIKNEKNLNYQKYANNLQLEYVEYEVTIEQQLKYHFPSLLRGEVYSFAIVFKYADGTYSPAFPIPGIPGLGVSSTNSLPHSSQAGNSSTQNTGGGSSGGTGGGTTGSGGGTNTDTGADDYYNPVKVEHLDTTNQHERKRNPSDQKDRPLESDKFEEGVKADVDNIDTTEADVIDAAGCQDTPYGCSEGQHTTSQDLHDVNNSVIENANLLSGYGKDNPDPDVDTTTTLKDAASKLIEDGVKNREYVTRKKPVLKYTQESKDNPGTGVVDPESNLDTQTVIFTQENVGESHIQVPIGSKGTIRADNWVDSLGNPITEQKPKVISRGKFHTYQSVVKYPDDKDCDGNYFFPQTNEYFPRVPNTYEKPHFVSHQNGVINKYQPDNYEYAKTFIRLMGLKVSNIHIPTDDELPKPLCPTSPFKIVYVKRTDENKSIFAKAYLQGIFTGSIYGDIQAFGRHGVNSFEHVDRYIAAGDDGFSRLGEQSFDPVYLAHSPDLDADNSYLPITKIRPELKFVGSGWKHGDYAEGEKPINRMTGKQRDQAGTRISNNLNHYEKSDGNASTIVGFSYAPSNSVVTKPPGMKYTLNNRFRPSSVYLEASARMFGDDLDKSFIGATLEHFFPLECNAPYVSLYRDLPDQYGSVVGAKYIDLGLVATQVQGTGTKAIEGICGDTWIGPWSKKFSSHVSNKKGNFFNPPAKADSVCRPRSYCDSPEDIIFNTMGIDFYPTKLPVSGDIYDPKNYAGLHTVAGSCGEDGLSRSAVEAAGIGHSESDYYGPELLKGLTHCIIESHINPWLLQTGEGSQVVEGKVYYPKLKDLYLDSDAPNKHPWEKSFLNRIYKLIEQPSKSQLTLKAAIRTFINAVIPVGLLLNYQNLSAIFNLAAYWMISPMLMAFWVLAANTLFTDKRLNQLLGIGECLRDEEGGDFDGTIEQFEDAYCKYNYDYSSVNEIQHYNTFVLPYNTCVCDECDKELTTNEIYYSPKQNLDTEIDSYRDIRMNEFNTLPANRGQLKKLFAQNNNLYCLTTDALGIIKETDGQVSNQIAYQLAGLDGMLSDPQFIFEEVEGGFAGTHSPNALISTPFGTFYVDDEGLKIYQFTGNLPKEISAVGMQNFFKENLGFCNPQECYDEKTGVGNHYALGFDPRYNRILITKQDGCASFTASYSPMGDKARWISFHSYTPQAYLWDRESMFSILYDKGEVWKHHVKNSYQEFYGTKYPMLLEFTAIEENQEEFTFKNLKLSTKAEKVVEDQKYPAKDLDITFNKLATWNSTQGTGVLDLQLIKNNFGDRNSQYERTVENYGNPKLFKVGRKWETNQLKDLTVIGCNDMSLFMSNCNCQVIPDINQGLFDCNVTSKQDGVNRQFTDDFLTFRYIFDNRNDIRLYVLSHQVNETPDLKKQSE